MAIGREQTPQKATHCFISPSTSSLWLKSGNRSLTLRAGRLSRQAIIRKTGDSELGTNEYKYKRVGNFTFAVTVNTWLIICRRQKVPALHTKNLKVLEFL